MGTYTVTYNVTDSSDNAAVEVSRTVNVVASEAPVITVLGSDPVTLEEGDTYEDVNSCKSTLLSAWAPPLMIFIIGTGSVRAASPPRYR